MKILLAYGSVYGSTEEIAQKLAKILTDQGESVDLLRLKKRTRVDLSQYDGVILGTPVYTDNPLAECKLFWENYEDELLTKRFGFFLTGANPKKLEKRIRYFLSFDLQNVIVAKGHFGGRFIEVKKMRFLHRMYMKMIAAQEGIPNIQLSEENALAFANDYLGIVYEEAMPACAEDEE